MLYGSKVSLCADNMNLSKLETSPSLKLQRYYHYISEFDPDISHISGKDNVVADLLSRMDFKSEMVEEVAELDDFPLLPRFIKAKQDEENMELNDKMIYADVEGCFLIVTKEKGQIVAPNAIQSEILKWIHECYMHPGISRMYNSIKEMFWWKGMFKDVAEYVDSCEVCRVNKVNKKKYGLLKATDLDEDISKFECFSLDICGYFSCGWRRCRI